MSFTQHLRQIQIKHNSFLCIGLDVDLEKIPPHLKTMKNPALEFNRQIIDATYDLVCAYKPNLAFYEAMGENGITTLRETLKFVPKSVQSAVDGELEPLTIEVPFPCTSISGYFMVATTATRVAVVHPLLVASI